jgi:hypothetical protein
MRPKRVLRRAALITSIIVLFFINTLAYAATDDYIFNGSPAATYLGRAEAQELIRNLDFADLSPEFQAKDAIVRGGALNIIKAYDNRFYPNEVVSNEQALGYVLRMIGMEQISHDMSLTLQPTLPANISTDDLWSMGYIAQASQMGIISQAQYTDALAPDPAALDPNMNFARTAPVTREQLADWLMRALQTVNAAVFELGRAEQDIYEYDDWRDINPQFIRAVELMSEANIIMGDEGRFRPKGSVTNAEMAEIIKNLDSLYYPLMGIEKKHGTVGGIKDSQTETTASAGLSRDIYIRAANGSIDVLRFTMDVSDSPQAGSTDSVVLRGGSVVGLGELQEGDMIEYLVRPADYRLLYAQVIDDINFRLVRGELNAVDMNGGTISIVDATGKKYQYTMAANLYGADDGVEYIRVSKIRRAPSELPFGSVIEICLKNNIVDEINYIGDPAMRKSSFGVVMENNPALGYIVIASDDGTTENKKYLAYSVKSERKSYFDNADEVGYLDSVFDTYGFDPVDRSISDIEPGDIVSYTTEGDYVTEIYAYEELRAVFGEIKGLRVRNNATYILLKLGDGETLLINTPLGTRVTKAGKPADIQDIVPGDKARLLVNAISVGAVNAIQTVKEIIIDDASGGITGILSGTLAGVDKIQKQLRIANSRMLSKQGWTNEKQLILLPYSNNIECYNESRRMSIEYAASRFKNANGLFYAALETTYAGERVKKLTFRPNRDERLEPDVVLGSNGSGSLFVSGNPSPITTDSGTIVRLFGRLTDTRHIRPSQYASVCLNGENTAAVVDIKPIPDTNGVIIARGRVMAIDECKGFRVESMALLYGTEWSYTPVERRFVVDGQTLFVTPNGINPNYFFRGYTPQSSISRVFNIVIDGARAARIIEAPYVTKNLRGVVYSQADGLIYIRDTAAYDDATGKWSATSASDATAVVSVPLNSIIVKESRLIEASELQPGDNARVMTDSLPAYTPGMGLVGYIILVER